VREHGLEHELELLRELSFKIYFLCGIILFLIIYF